MSRAKPISCVAISIVIPPAASSRITLSTSATSSGSSALVTSSSSISVGLHRERAHDRDPLLLAAREPVGVLVALVGEAEAGEQLRRLGLRLRARRAERLARGERDVLEHAHVREEVERLEDDPDPAADPVDVDAARGDLLAVDDDPAGVDRLEQVDAAQQRRLARAGGADQADDLVLGDVEVDPAQHLELAERLAQPFDHDARSREAPGLPRAGRARRASP